MTCCAQTVLRPSVTAARLEVSAVWLLLTAAFCQACADAAGEGDSDNLETAATSSAASGETSVLAGSANYVFFDADEAANQKQQKKKGKGKKE